MIKNKYKLEKKNILRNSLIIKYIFTSMLIIIM